jgi:NAD(P)-dependent dehydrogenase (short-subunit alcohol dehydrogenase family)
LAYFTPIDNIAYYKCDVSKWEEVEAVSKKVIEEIGQPTVLVNNAGVAQGKLILDLSPEDIQQ